MYAHLQLAREQVVTDRHSRRDSRPRFKPDDPGAFGNQLGNRLSAAREKLDLDLGGYDERRLLKIRLREGESAPDFGAIPGIELVSQEAKTLVLAFATEQGLQEFEQRIATLARGGRPTRQELFFAIEDFDHWTPDERLGNALRDQGFPDAELFVLDVELWPQERSDRRESMLTAFDDALERAGIQKLDSLNQPSLVMVRVRCDRNQAEALLLRHRDVRTVDLPPRLGLEFGLIATELQAIETPSPPPANAPSIAILDSGIASGHPFLGPAVGDAQGFLLPEREADDRVPEGHGTFVAGLALYGDMEESIRGKRFEPTLRLFSGKVFRDDGSDETRFVESAIEEAVRYFVGEYGCRIFNVSYGDLNKVYDGRHLRGLAYTLDRLSRDLGVLFVVPAGNLRLSDLPPDLTTAYPNYLLEEGSRLLDPGTALNAVTVGGLAKHVATTAALRHPNTLEDVPVAQPGCPSPITRTGPSLKGSVKPDFVEHAGNVAVDRRRRPQTSGLGVVSLRSGFATGRLFGESLGTSFAAPLVSRKAARLLDELPDATPNLLRALLGAHARWPAASEDLLNHANDREGKESLLRAIGYGRIDEAALYRSLDGVVTLIAEDEVGKDQHHFYEIPTPGDFWAGARRSRTLSIGLAYTPEVRTTRLEYRATRIRFSLVNSSDLDTVATAFRRQREKPMRERGTNRDISSDKRDGGTLQVSRWQFRGAIQPGRLFLVVTRQDATWSTAQDENEPYAICAVLDDRERAEVNLYAEMRAMLQARARIRIKT